MQNIEQFVKERQEMKPLQTCESYFLTFPKQMRCLSYKICLTKNVQVDTRFYQATDVILILPSDPDGFDWPVIA